MIVRIRSTAAGERGGVMVLVALGLPTLLILIAFVIDVANWFEHKRHLQMQADAGVLAAAQEVRFACDDAAIADTATRYSGTQWNPQVGGTPPTRIFRRLNSKTFHGQATTGKPERST